MTVTMQDVRSRLDADEVDYSSAARLGPEAMPYLAELSSGTDAMLASKATYLASLIGGEGAAQVVETAANRPESAVRVAAAAGLRNLGAQAAEPLADRLLEDHDVGVRKIAVRSVAGMGPLMAARIDRVAREDAEPVIRELARQVAPPTDQPPA